MSVVICAYTGRRWDDLMAALDSVAGQRVPVFETIVCVDHNPQLAADLAEARPDVVVVENEERQGLSGGRNTAVRRTRGDIVAFLDDDAVARPDWLEQLLGAFEDERVVGVGGTAVPRWDGGRPGWFPEEYDWVVGCTHRGTPLERTAVRNVIGCNMAFRRDALVAAGGFAHELGRIGTIPLGCEETELCIRLRQADPGVRIVFEPRAVVEHHVTPERRTFRYFRSRCLAEGASKAVVSSLVGAGDGMASERHYATRVLPRAAVRGVAATVTGDRHGVLRSGAIVTGLAAFGTGFARAALSSRRTRAADRPPTGDRRVPTSEGASS